MSEYRPGPVECAVIRDLEGTPERVRRSGLAAVALTLARHLDLADRPSGAAMAAKELTAVQDRLRRLVPPERAEDGVDELLARRDARRSAG